MPPTHSTKRNPGKTKRSRPVLTGPPARSAGLPYPLQLPPDVGAPLAPEGSLRLSRGYYPNARELATMPNAAKELARLGEYEKALGSAVTSAETVAKAIEIALRWRREREVAARWAAYAQAEDVQAWAGAMKLLHEVRPLFAHAIKKDGKLARAYVWLAAFFAEAHVTAKKANATKAKKARAKTKAEADAAKAAAVAAATPKATVEPARARGRVITINT